jgi:hypothetical protein
MLFQSHIQLYNLETDSFLIPLLPTEKLVSGDFTDLGELAQQLNKACNRSKWVIVDSVFRQIGGMEVELVETSLKLLEIT